MYDYVLQLGFKLETQNIVQVYKSFLKNNGVKDKERKWLPHITIDLYNCDNKKEFIKKIDLIAENIQCFEVQCSNLNDFDDKTLYIEPFDKEKLLEIKTLFNEGLDNYRLENRIYREYKPHITLCTNDDLSLAKILVNKAFKPFICKVKYLWVYNQEMKLIKGYELKE